MNRAINFYIICLFAISAVAHGQTRIDKTDFLQRNEDKGHICGYSAHDDPIVRHIEAILFAMETYAWSKHVEHIQEIKDISEMVTDNSSCSFNYRIAETIIKDDIEYVAIEFSEGESCKILITNTGLTKAEEEKLQMVFHLYGLGKDSVIEISYQLENTAKKMHEQAIEACQRTLNINYCQDSINRY